MKKHRHIQSFSGSPQDKTGLLDEYRKAKADHRRLERFHSSQDSASRDSKLISILSNSTDVYKKIKSSKNNQSKIHTLHVGHNTYIGKDVPDGMYHSISQLKSVNTEPSLSSQPFFHDFDLIMNLCSSSSLPPISFEKSSEILHRMKVSVTDMYSITGSHYIHAGPVGLKHFHMLLCGLIMDINSISLSEINTVYAMVLFKGHGKDKTSDRSYRTISTRPLVAKALDLYVRDLNLDKWNHDQAPTQFQGEGSSHELAAILFTECIQHSLFIAKEPLFAIYLDAMSAFDNVLRQLLIRNLYLCGTSPASTKYINTRLENRKTIVDWDKNLMGPISDEKGVEQGGCNSSEYYKNFGKPQLELAQILGLECH